MVDVVRGLQGLFYIIWILVGIAVLVALFLAISLLGNLGGMPLSAIAGSAIGSKIMSGQNYGELLQTLDEKTTACIKSAIGESRYNDILNNRAQPTEDEIQKGTQCVDSNS